MQRVFPFQHRPPLVPVLREFREDAVKVDLPAPSGAKAAGPLHPVLVAAIHAGASVRAELGILDVESADARVIQVQELEIVELLQEKMTGIVKDSGAPVLPDCLQEALPGRAVVQVFAGVQLVTQVYVVVLKHIENRQPATAQLRKGLLNQAGRALRPRIVKRPGKRA